MDSTNSVFSRGFKWGRSQSLPLIMQTEAAECGLACLAMVSRFHGHDVDLPSLRRLLSSSIKGVNLSRIITMASELDFVPRPLRLDLASLSRLKVPCILHWDLNHFVVLKRVTGKSVVIHDPAMGVRHMSMSNVSKHFTGVAVELTPAPGFRPVHERQTISLGALAGRVSGIGRALSLVLGLALAIEILALFVPFFMQWVLDQVIVSGDHNLLDLLGITFLFLIAFQVVLTAVRARSISWVASGLNAQWTVNLFSHLLSLPSDWFGKRHVGDVVSRFNSVQSVQQTLTTSFTTSLLDGLMALVTLVLMFVYSAKLSLVVTAGVLLYIGIRWFSFRILRQSQEEQLVCAARQQSEMMESVRGIQTIKLANKQPVRLSRYANATVASINRNFSVQQLTIVFEALNQFVFGILKVVLIWWGAELVLDGEFTAGMLVAFTTYADQFTSRGGSVIDKIMEFRMLSLHAERIADVALTEPEKHFSAIYLGLDPEPSVEVRNVSFRYAAGEPWVVRHLSLHIAVGESVAIVGPSGCGKSTLAKLILGLLEPTEGEILVGGIDIRKVGLEHYRSLVGAVMQEDQLFAGSIADNIAFFDPDANSTKIEIAAGLAAIHDDIIAMPMGYNTLVGDMGSALSGGQKQRVSLARALYRFPKILVLDEATSHLDTHCEKVVSTAVAASNVTRIIIAHRPETIALADRVFMLKQERAKAEANAQSTTAPELQHA